MPTRSKLGALPAPVAAPPILYIQCLEIPAQDTFFWIESRMFRALHLKNCTEEPSDATRRLHMGKLPSFARQHTIAQLSCASPAPPSLHADIVASVEKLFYESEESMNVSLGKRCAWEPSAFGFAEVDGFPGGEVGSRCYTQPPVQ